MILEKHFQKFSSFDVLTTFNNFDKTTFTTNSMFVDLSDVYLFLISDWKNLHIISPRCSAYHPSVLFTKILNNKC